MQGIDKPSKTVIVLSASLYLIQKCTIIIIQYGNIRFLSLNKKPKKTSQRMFKHAGAQIKENDCIIYKPCET